MNYNQDDLKYLNYLKHIYSILWNFLLLFTNQGLVILCLTSIWNIKTVLFLELIFSQIHLNRLWLHKDLIHCKTWFVGLNRPSIFWPWMGFYCIALERKTDLFLLILFLLSNSQVLNLRHFEGRFVGCNRIIPEIHKIRVERMALITNIHLI